MSIWELKGDLPSTARRFCKVGALIGGSVARNIYEGRAPMHGAGDIDLVVPFECWSRAAELIPSTAEVNKMGGFRFRDGIGVLHEVWPCNVFQLLSEALTKDGTDVVIVDVVRKRVYRAEHCLS